MSNINQAETEKFLTYHSNPKALVAKDLEQIKEWIVKYPYCQSLKFLAAQTAQSTPEYQNYLAKAATFSPDRTILFDFIHQPENFCSEMVALDPIDQVSENIKSDVPFGFDLNEMYGSELRDSKVNEETTDETIEVAEDLQTENIESEIAEESGLKEKTEVSEKVEETAVEDKSDFSEENTETVDAEEIQEVKPSENGIHEEEKGETEPANKQNSNVFGIDLNEILGSEDQKDSRIENLHDQSSKVSVNEEEKELTDDDEIQEYEAKEIEFQKEEIINDDTDQKEGNDNEVEEHPVTAEIETNSAITAETEEIQENETSESEIKEEIANNDNVEEIKADQQEELKEETENETQSSTIEETEENQETEPEEEIHKEEQAETVDQEVEELTTNQQEENENIDVVGHLKTEEIEKRESEIIEEEVSNDDELTIDQQEENESAEVENLETEEIKTEALAISETEEISQPEAAELEVVEEIQQLEEEEIEDKEIVDEQETAIETEESKISEEPIEIEESPEVAQEKEEDSNLETVAETSEEEVTAESESDTPVEQIELEQRLVENVEKLATNDDVEEASEEEIENKESESPSKTEVPKIETIQQVKESFVFETPIPNFFAFQKREDKASIAEDVTTQKTEDAVSQYNDDSMPYTFLWWLNKTRKEHASTHQPYTSFQLDTSKKIDQPQIKKDNLDRQIAENIFHLRGVEGFSDSSSQGNQTVPFEFLKKEYQIIEKFIKEEPQIRPPAPNKIDTENKAKKSSEDSNEVVSETLAKIYVEQMLYHKALDVYKKLSLKFPEKSTYFASQIKYLELKVN